MNKSSLNLKNLNHVRFNCSNLTEIICRENPTFVFVNKRSLNRNCGVQIVSVFLMNYSVNSPVDLIMFDSVLFYFEQ